MLILWETSKEIVEYEGNNLSITAHAFGTLPKIFGKTPEELEHFG